MNDRMVWIDCEMTGLSLSDDALIEVAALVTDSELNVLGEGVDIRQNYRPFLEQSKLKVDHVHFHVYPRSLNDYLYQVSEQYETDLFADLDETEAAAVAKARDTDLDQLDAGEVRDQAARVVAGLDADRAGAVLFEEGVERDRGLLDRVVVPETQRISHK